MSPFKPKEDFDYGEPAECETLYTELSFRHDYESKRMISIGVLKNDAIGKNGTISFQIISFYPDKICNVSTADLTEEEIDVVMEGLKKAKDKMMEYKLKPDDEEPEDTYGDDDSGGDNSTHSDDYGDSDSQEERGFDDDERD